MTVGLLMQVLSKLPPSMPVSIPDHDGTTRDVGAVATIHCISIGEAGVGRTPAVVLLRPGGLEAMLAAQRGGSPCL